MERSIGAVCVALGVAVAVGVWPRGPAQGATAEWAAAEVIEVASSPSAERRARPPWLGPSTEAARARARFGGASCEAGPPRGPRAWLLGRRAAIDRLRQEDWEELPGVGPSLAGRIADRVRRRGPLRSLAQLDEVPGIGPARLRVLGRWLEGASLGHAVAPTGPSR